MPSQSDAEDSSDIKLLFGLGVVFYGFIFMAIRARHGSPFMGNPLQFPQMAGGRQAHYDGANIYVAP
jgi:hypothetical protein